MSKTVIYFPPAEKPETLPTLTLTEDPAYFAQEHPDELPQAEVKGDRLVFVKGHTEPEDGEADGTPFESQPIRGYAVLIPVADDFTLED